MCSDLLWAGGRLVFTAEAEQGSDAIKCFKSTVSLQLAGASQNDCVFSMYNSN